MLGAVTDAKDARTAMCVPLAGFLITWSFPIYLNLIKAKELDGFKESRVGIEGPVNAKPIAENYHEKDVEAAGVEVVAKGLFTNFFSPVRAHLFDAARWIKLRPNRWILSATSKRSCRGVDRIGKSGSFTRVEPHRYNQPVHNIRTFFNGRRR